jgi:hypothetical protein
MPQGLLALRLPSLTGVAHFTDHIGGTSTAGERKNIATYTDPTRTKIEATIKPKKLRHLGAVPLTKMRHLVPGCGVIPHAYNVLTQLLFHLRRNTISVFRLVYVLHEDGDMTTPKAAELQHAVEAY